VNTVIGADYPFNALTSMAAIDRPRPTFRVIAFGLTLDPFVFFNGCGFFIPAFGMCGILMTT
jgi:hypothetical protein